MIPKGSSTLRYFHSKRGSERNIQIKKNPSKWSLRGALLCWCHSSNTEEHVFNIELWKHYNFYVA